MTRPSPEQGVAAADGSPRPSCLDVQLEITYGEHPEFVAWWVSGLHDNTWLSGQGHPGAPPSIVHEDCVPSGCFALSVVDLLGAGDSTYRVIAGDGQVLVEPSNLGTYDEVRFCHNVERGTLTCDVPHGDAPLPCTPIPPTLTTQGPAPGGRGFLLLALLLLAGALYRTLRARREAPPSRARSHAIDRILALGVGVAFTPWFMKDTDVAGALIMHDTVRDALWAIDIIDGNNGPIFGPLIGGTDGTLGRLWFFLYAPVYITPYIENAVIGYVASYALSVAATTLLGIRCFGRGAGLVGGMMFAAHPLVHENYNWFAHGNLLFLTASLSLLAAYEAFAQRRSVMVIPALFWAAVSVQLHLVGIAIPIILLILASIARSDSDSVDTGWAIAAASVAFLPGLPVFLASGQVEGWLPTLAKQSLLPFAVAAGLWIARPRWSLGAGRRWILTLVVTGIALTGSSVLRGIPALQLLDLVIGFGVGPGGSGLEAPPWRILSALPSESPSAQWVGLLLTALGLVVGASRPAPGIHGHTLLRTTLVVTVLLSAGFWSLGPYETRYGWLIAIPVSLAGGVGLAATWAALAGLHRFGRLVSAPAFILGIVALVHGQGAVFLGLKLLAITGGLALVLPPFARVLPPTVACILFVLGPTTAARQAGVAGVLGVDLALWRDVIALPGMELPRASACLHRAPELHPAPPASWWLFEWLAVRRGAVQPCLDSWILHGGPVEGGIPVGQLGAHAVHESAHLDLNATHLRATTAFNGHKWPVQLASLPVRSSMSRALPAAALNGLRRPALMFTPDEHGVSARVSTQIDGPHPPHTLIVRVVATKADADGLVDCEVTAWLPGEPLHGTPSGLGAWSFELTEDARWLPLEIEVRDCTVWELDVFPIAEGLAPPPDMCLLGTTGTGL